MERCCCKIIEIYFHQLLFYMYVIYQKIKYLLLNYLIRCMVQKYFDWMQWAQDIWNIEMDFNQLLWL